MCLHACSQSGAPGGAKLLKWELGPLRLKEVAAIATAAEGALGATPAGTVTKVWDILLTKDAPVGQDMVVTAESQLTGQRQSFTVNLRPPTPTAEADYVWPVLEMTALATVIAVAVALVVWLSAAPPPQRSPASPVSPTRQRLSGSAQHTPRSVGGKKPVSLS